MFPTSIKGTIELSTCEPSDIPRILINVRSELEAASARDIHLSENKISFRGGIFRLVTNWNVLVPIGSGEIEVDPGSPPVLKYNFSTLEILVIASLMALFVGGSMALARPITLQTMEFPIVAWLWLFGMNYLVAAFRLPAFVRRAIDA